ncbi:TAF1 [Auxenochlorella protothecoides x Auxenochlorella symbiontica]
MAEGQAQPEVFTDTDGVRRMKGVSIVVPVVTGTISFWLAKKATDHASHKWTIYLRHAKNEDLAHLVSKVTFGLHSSFANPNRDVEYQPFELTEVGWGEFDITIKVRQGMPPSAGFFRGLLSSGSWGKYQSEPFLRCTSERMSGKDLWSCTITSPCTTPAGATTPSVRWCTKFMMRSCCGSRRRRCIAAWPPTPPPPPRSPSWPSSTPSSTRITSTAGCSTLGSGWRPSPTM